MKKTKPRVKPLSKGGYVVIRDRWIPDKVFRLGEEVERDNYISRCGRNYQDSYDYQRVDNVVEFFRRHSKAVGF